MSAKTGAQTLNVKKGDLVQMLSGKDRGKQGRILEARPREGRVIVENLNVMTRHTRPRPLSKTKHWRLAEVVEKAR